MSAHTGDKARFNNVRKRKVARKNTLRLLRESIQKPEAAKTAPVPPPAS